VLRVAAASVLAAMGALFVWVGLDEWLGRSLAAQLVSVGSALAVAALAYAGSARILGVRELEALLLLRARRSDEPEER
jgi:hypothetical protein